MLAQNRKEFHSAGTLPKALEIQIMLQERGTGFYLILGMVLASGSLICTCGFMLVRGRHLLLMNAQLPYILNCVAEDLEPNLELRSLKNRSSGFPLVRLHVQGS